MKPIPSNKEPARPIEQPPYLLGATNIHSTDEALHQQAAQSTVQTIGYYQGGYGVNGATIQHGQPTYHALNNFKDLNISLKLYQGAAQDRMQPSKYGPQLDSARKKNDSVKSGNSRLFNRHYVRDLISEQ